MTSKKLGKLRRRLKALYGAGRKSKQLVALAQALGRRRDKRGSYTWISREFAHLPPVSIPQHSAGVNRFTSEGILDSLESQDIYAWEQRLHQESQGRT